MEAAEKLHGLLDIRDRKWYHKRYKQCFIAKEAYQVMINAELAVDEKDAKLLGNRLIKKKIIEHVERKHKNFVNEYYYYRFIHPQFVSRHEHNKTTTKTGFMNKLPKLGNRHSNTLSKVNYDAVDLESPTSFDQDINGDVYAMDENKKEDAQKLIRQRKLKENAEKLRPNLDIQNRTYRLKKYKQCFIGHEAIPIIIDLGIADTENQAITFCNQLISLKIIEHVEQQHSFLNGNYYYRYINDPNKGNNSNADSSDSPNKTDSSNGDDSKSQNHTATPSTIDEEQMAELEEKGRILKEHLEIRDRKWWGKSYTKCFVGNQAVQTMIKSQFVKDEKEAILLGNKLINAKIIQHYLHEHTFENKYYFYKFVTDIEEELESKEYDDEFGHFPSLKQNTLSIKGLKSIPKPTLFFTLGYNQFTKELYQKYNIIELPPSIPKSAIVWGCDQFQYQLNHHFSSKDNTARSNTKSLGSALQSPALQLTPVSQSSHGPSDVPSVNDVVARQSQEVIVTTKKKEDYINMIGLLYQKYISLSAEMQVNISYSTRSRLIHLIEKQDMNELSHQDIFELFDQSIKELLGLMSDSYTRFKRTKEFDKVGSLQKTSYSPINTASSGFPDTPENH